MARHKKGEDVNGWLIVDKPRGMGSTDVVNMTRRMFKAKKNGHAGTLDPFATGVLPVAFGEATKLLPLVTDGRKEYEFVLQWGAETNTGDSEGEIVSRCEKVPSREDILAVLPQFIGEITQVPPAFSAIKINGQRAYDLARKGEDVAVPERKVEIYTLELLEELPGCQARFRVVCSKGTYVRALGRDLARKLGTFGYLQELRRTKCGKFSLEDTILLENLKKVVHTDALKEFLLPLITSLRDIAVLAVSEADAAKLRLGQGLSPKNYDIDNLKDKQAVAVFEGSPAAIVRIDERKISPVRVFNC
ncbi:MAG: tRNA pseudouridine(55) synthase TruB [Alphaproteobacteria bacterium]|nr:tRNA pseudouridine(55) synthase TruB [Alphaproteobacteria bacterium]